MNFSASKAVSNFRSFFLSKFVLSSAAVLFTAAIAWAAITQSGSVFISPNNIFIGFGGSDGTLTIDTDTLSVSGDFGSLQVGNDAGFTGTLNIQNGGVLNNQIQSNIGQIGKGVVNLSSGGKLNDGTVFLGNFPGSEGVATVEDAGSKWTTDQYFIVAGQGDGEITVTNGGVVEAGTNFDVGTGGGAIGTATISGGGVVNVVGVPFGSSQIGADLAANGLVTVTDAGSEFNVNGFLSIGVGSDFGDGGPTGPTFGRLDVLAGGVVTSVNGAQIGGDFNSIGPGFGTGTVTVEGPESKWTSDNWINIGKFRGNGTLEILAGGEVSIPTLDRGLSVGEESTGVGSLLVDGFSLVDDITTPSQLTVSRHFYIGRRGTGSVDISGGGSVRAEFLRMADAASGSGILNIFGEGSLLHLQGQIAADDRPFVDIGRNGSAVANITGGGRFLMVANTETGTQSISGLNVGRELGSVGTLNLSDIGSELLFTGLFRRVPIIGRSGNGTVNVLNGAHFINDPASNPNSFTVVGRTPTGVGIVNVSDAGSLFNAGSFLRIGLETSGAPGGTGTVNVSNGGQLIAPRVDIGSNGQLNSDVPFNVASGANTSTVDLRGGSVNAGTVDVGSGGTISGTGTVGGNLDVSSGGAINAGVSGSGSSLITVTGSATVGGVVNVSLNNGFVPQIGDSFTLVTSSGGSFAGSTLSVPGLPAEISATSSFDGTNFVVAFIETPTEILFASLDIEKAHVDLKEEKNGKDKDKIDVRGRFVLGDGNNGINPPGEEVVVTLAGFSQTLPAGSFVLDDDEIEYEFKGPKGGVTKVKIKGDGRFEIKAKELDLNGTDLGGPVPFSLTIGDDTGETSITFKVDKKGRKGKFKGKKDDDD